MQGTRPGRADGHTDSRITSVIVVSVQYSSQYHKDTIRVQARVDKDIESER